MYRYPPNIYTEVRAEDVFSTRINFKNYELFENKTKKDKGVIVRVFDGKIWYCSSTTDIGTIQQEIDSLAKMTSPTGNVSDHPAIKLMEINRGIELEFRNESAESIPNHEKINLLSAYVNAVKDIEEVKKSEISYFDRYTVKQITTSKGTDVTFDIQNIGIILRYTVVAKGTPFSNVINICGTCLDDITGKTQQVKDCIEKDIAYVREAVPVEPGTYTCILSPMASGVFAHESFGHKSESDFMVGDETMKKEWCLGKKVGSDILNIIDDGTIKGSGYTLYDDEGNKARNNYIIRNGILSGRLHSSSTAAALAESVTGNARAMNFEFTPMVRMTTTYIGAGTLTKEELFAGVKRGVFIEDIRHGSGMSTFTIAPAKAYMIRDGKIAEPVKVAVITGNVMATLNQIDGLSNEVTLLSFGSGGCGKMEQYPLPVGFGGPYVRVNGIHVQ